MADLFGTLGDGAEVTFSGTLGDETGVDTFSGRGFLNMDVSCLMASICLVPTLETWIASGCWRSRIISAGDCMATSVGVADGIGAFWGNNLRVSVTHLALDLLKNTR